MDFKKLIDDKTVCEIRSDNDLQTFDVGVIFHTNAHSIFVICFGKDGAFSKYAMIPIDFICSVSYGTEYIKNLNIPDVSIDENMNFSEWECIQDVFEFLKNNSSVVAFYDYDETELARGIIEDYDDDSATVHIIDDESGDFDGTMILTTSQYFTLEWTNKSN